MIEWLVKHRAPVYLVVACTILFGTVTYMDLPREANPDVKVPVVMVATPYIGVSPEDIESLVTIPMERELSGIKDLKKMTSTSAEGASIIALEFVPEVVIQDALQRVRDRVSRAKAKLPADAEEPDIREISFSDFPILILSVGGPADEEVLKKLGEELEDDLGTVKGVLEAKLSGGRERQIRVQVNPNRLQHYSLGLNDVLGALANENVNVPGGNVKVGASNYLLRVPGEFKTARDLLDVAIKRVGDRPVFVRDVAEVVDGFADRSSYSRMNGRPSISIAVSKRTGANILDVAEKVKAIAAEHQETWPSGVTFQVLGDQSGNIRDMVNDLENNIISALVLVVAVILFFMGFRNSMFVAAAIPLSMLLGMLAISIFGMTLNMVVLFSLILALGMLVDNALVLVENIYRHIEEGKDLATAAIDGTNEIAGAVAASTLTTVAAFAPLVFWTGIMGQFMGFLPKTVIITLTASLVVAVFFLPVFAARFMKKSKKAPSDTSSDDPEKELPPLPTGKTMVLYQRILDLSIRFRYVSAGLVTLMLFVTFAIYGKYNHGTEFFPDSEPDQGTISIRAPDGTDLEETDRIVRRVEEMLAAEENVEVYVSETGVAGGGDPMSGAQAAANQARITIDFLPHSSKAKKGEKERVESSDLTIDRLRKKVVTIAGAKITVEKQGMGPPVGKPISVEVSGENFHTVGQAAAKIRRQIAALEGTTDLTDDYRVGRPEMRLRIDRGAANRIGASTQSIAGTVRTAVAGTKATALRDGEDEHDIMVELAPRYRNDLQAVLSLRVPGTSPTSPKTYPVPLSSVASYRLSGGSGSIRHIDQDLVVTIGGDVLKGYNVNAVREAVVKFIKETKPPPGVKMRLGGASDEQEEAQAFLSRAFAIALFLILLVLVAQFNSFSIPLIILGSVLLSLVGVLGGLLITGTPFGVIMTGLGVISLAGVVVNNAIVLLDYVGQLRERGLSVRDCLVRAGVVRFRPVMLTASTTILGLVPMATGVSIDFKKLSVVIGSPTAGWWAPMAIAMIFGLAFATILTLVMVPTFYSILEDFTWVRGRIRRWYGLRFKPAAAE